MSEERKVVSDQVAELLKKRKPTIQKLVRGLHDLFEEKTLVAWLTQQQFESADDFYVGFYRKLGTTMSVVEIHRILIDRRISRPRMGIVGFTKFDQVNGFPVYLNSECPLFPGLRNKEQGEQPVRCVPQGTRGVIVLDDVLREESVSLGERYSYVVLLDLPDGKLRVELRPQSFEPVLD